MRKETCSHFDATSRSAAPIYNDEMAEDRETENRASNQVDPDESSEPAPASSEARPEVDTEPTPVSSEARPEVDTEPASAPSSQAFYAQGSNVALYTEGVSYYHPEELAALLRRRAGVTPWPEKASGGRPTRARDSFGGQSQKLTPGDAPGMPMGGQRFEFETRGYEFGRRMLDGVPVGPANGADEDLGDMNGQITQSWTRARTQGAGQLRRFLDSGRSGHGMAPT